MADNYLITGYWGEPHVTAENDRGFNAAVFGAGKFVLPVGEMFRAEYIGNNTVRVYDGKLIDNGAVAGIPAGKYIDLLIPEAGQGMNRNDLIIFQYSQDASTLIESGVFRVLPGTETNVTAVDPLLTEEDLLTDKATFDQMALWRVPVSGANISDPVQLFDVSKNLKNAGPAVVEATSDDGVAYSATVPGVTELFPGLEVTIVPKTESASTAITLDINGLGAKNVRLPLTTNTAILVQPTQESFFVDNRPVKLIYDDQYASKGAWVVVGRQRTSVADLYGSAPVQMELLWSNASPTSAFEGQPAPFPADVDIQEYDMICCEFRINATSTAGVTVFVPKEGRVMASGFNITHYYRSVRFNSSEGVVFGGGFQTKAAAPTTEVSDNTSCIPVRIYGIRGVK